jgi:hypothetical protein
LLIILGLAALWLGRSTVERLTPKRPEVEEPVIGPFVISDRAAAIWGLACLVAIVPAGIAGLELLIR